MKQMMDLVSYRAVKAISPIKLFAYDDIPNALRFMRGANHIGKIIISNAGYTDCTVPVRPAIRQLSLRPDVSYLIVGGLKGLCGSLAVDMARHGARNVVILGRSGYDDIRSQGVLKDLRAHGCIADLVRGDVSNFDDVRRTFASASKPIAGVIQGAMVLRDKPFEMMTHTEYHTTIASKVAGTWNLHNAALEAGLNLDFFTLLSSISGLIGQPAQANYAAANVFLDNFASYRHGLGLNANSVDLGAIEDVGYMAEHSELITALDTSAWTPINESLFHTIVRNSILRQVTPSTTTFAAAPNAAEYSQLITSISIPQSTSSRLLSDPRFSSLVFGSSSTGSSSGSGQSESQKAISAFLLVAKTNPTDPNLHAMVVDVCNTQFQKTLGLDEPLEPAKSLGAYGLDSLAAVEFRNWVRASLGSELTTLEVTGAGSLLALGEKILGRVLASFAAEGK